MALAAGDGHFDVIVEELLMIVPLYVCVCAEVRKGMQS